jgi:uncharacterized protein (TIGR03435 family)
MDSEGFDMNAKAERPSSLEELHAMLQDLLADRFKLRFHRENREMPMYALTVDKDGPKLTPHEARSAGDPWIEPKADPSSEGRRKTTWHATFAPMDFFAWRLSSFMDRPVVDQTNLKGQLRFRFGVYARAASAAAGRSRWGRGSRETGRWFQFHDRRVYAAAVGIKAGTSKGTGGNSGDRSGGETVRKLGEGT